MAEFVLVHGAWHGGWCWHRVVEALTRAGHRAHAVTLTGVGDRAHLLRPGIDLETHIEDVRAAIEAEEFVRPVLVVHSYAGMLGTALADRLPGRLRHLVYVDAVVPRPGESWSSTHASATRKARLEAAAHSTQHSFPAPDPAVFGLEAEDHTWVQRRQTPHPAATYTATLDFDVLRVAQTPRTFIDCIQPPLGTIDVIRTRVRDPKFWDGAWASGGRVIELSTGHDPMISAPLDLTRILESCAAPPTA